MRFALLGDDEDTRIFQRAIDAAPTHEIFSVPTSEWETLLARSDCDAVILARGSDEFLHTEQLKKLVGGGVRVVAVHPAADVLTAYEIEMIRRETSGVLIPFAAEWKHPAWDFLVDVLQGDKESAIGEIGQISFERSISDRSREVILARFAQDIALIRRLLGVVSSVNAVGASRDDTSWNSLTVHFANDIGRAATWSLVPGGEQSRVHLVGERGTATLNIPAGSDSNWVISQSDGRKQVFSSWNTASALADQIQSVIRGSEPSPSWSDACLDLEIAESAEKSLRRKRAIDLYTSERSEEKTFKGFMAASGCIVLVVILFAFLGLALWDGFRAPFREAVASVPGSDKAAERMRQTEPGWPLWVRMWPVYPLLAFLLLQFLLFITRPSVKEDARNAGIPSS